MTKKDKFIRHIYTGDNLPVLRSMDSETVDLIYLDPPFNSGKQWENPVQAGGKRALASFKDTWELSDSHPDEEYALGMQYPAALPLIDSLYAINGGSWKAYLIYMGIRLAEMRRILKPAGSIYYHCDPVMSHGVKLLMDSIFGKRLVNEIVWHYGGPSKLKIAFPRKNDAILFYTKNGKYDFSPQYNDLPQYLYERARKDPDGRMWVDQNLGNISVDLVEKMKKENRVFTTKTGKLRRKQYLDEMQGAQLDTVWDIPVINSQSKERTGYPTQKPLALLERIIKASSNKGDLVLDPFCGCATTCHAAEILGRQWIGIDFAEEAAKLVVDRLQKESDKQLKSRFADIKHIVIKGKQNLPARTDLPKRTDNAILKPRLYKIQNGKCAAPCGENGEGRALPIDAMDFDHIIAQSRGGQNTDDNLQLLCRNCNTTKGDRGMDYLRRRILQRRSKEIMEEWRRQWQNQKDKNAE